MQVNRSQNVRFRVICSWRLYVIFLLCSVAAAAPTRALAQEDGLTGRLGGTLSSFDFQYTRTEESRSPDTISFLGPDQSTLFVQFTGGKVPLPDDRAFFILVRSPRPPDLPALTRSDADWTVGAAKTLAVNLLPPDAEIDQLAATNDNELRAGCSSQLLADAVGGSTEQSCRVGLLKSSPEAVSFITLTATNGGVQVSTANPCEGVASWAAATAARLDAVHLMLDASSSASDADPWAARRLWQYAARLSVLASAQAASDAPLSVAWPSDLFTGAFNSYSKAMQQVASGLASRDLGKIDSAVDMISGANADIDHAQTLMEPPLNDCGISPS